MYSVFLIILFIFFILELSLRIFFEKLIVYTKRFYTEDSFFPKFDKTVLNKFYNKSYSNDLGWDNYIKNRENKKYLKLNNKKIFTFGDSFVFGKFSEESKKWQHYLSRETKLKVLNYGVNNHGLDQSFLKIKKHKKYLKSNILIVGFVPETILRITTSWKHFYEFGNIYAFKPRYEVKNKKLKLFKNPLDKNSSVRKLDKLVVDLKKKDPGYKFFYKNNLIKFPILLLFLKDFNYFFKISFYIFLYRYFNIKNIKKKILKLIVSKNIKLSHKFYKEKIKTDLIELFFKELKKFSNKQKANLFFVIFPQIYDLKFNSRKYYINFYKKIAKQNSIKIIDLTFQLQKKKIETYYLNDEFGGHLNKKGNKFVSDIICKFISQKGNIKS